MAIVDYHGLFRGFNDILHILCGSDDLIQQNRIGWAGAAIAVHVLGSLVMTVAGMATMVMLKKI